MRGREPQAPAAGPAMPPLPFTLRQLQYALAVAEDLSFRRAAVRCRVSQPSLSAQLAQLERALGVALFERNRRRVLVSASGRALLERARAALLAAEDLLAAARRADPLSGVLRIGVIPTVSPYLLPLAAPRLRAAFPQLRPVWVEDRTAALLDALADGSLDAVLLAAVAETAELEREPVAEDPFVLLARRDHPLGRRPGPASAAELRQAQVLLLDEGHCLRRQALELCTRARAREGEFRATSLPTLVQMVAGGAGVTLLPRLALATEARGTGLRARAFEPPAPGRTIVLAWRRSSPLGSALRRIGRVCREAWPRP